jgi:hypothetical protein
MRALDRLCVAGELRNTACCGIAEELSTDSGLGGRGKRVSLPEAVGEFGRAGELLRDEEAGA